MSSFLCCNTAHPNHRIGAQGNMGTVFNRNSSAASETPHLPSPGSAVGAAGRAAGEAAGRAAIAAAGLADDGPAGEVVGAAGSGAVVGAGASTRGPPATWGKGHQNLRSSAGTNQMLRICVGIKCPIKDSRGESIERASFPVRAGAPEESQAQCHAHLPTGAAGTAVAPSLACAARTRR